jgi:hypothetical protein
MAKTRSITIGEQIQNRIAGAKKWEAANPGQKWINGTHSPNEEKIYITKELLSSKAYRSLSRVSLLVYQDFLAKRIMIKDRRQKIWRVANNGELIYPYHEAIKNGFSRKQFRNAIDELQKKGFIDIPYQGRGGRKPKEGEGDVTLYWLDDRWTEYGTDDFRPPKKPRIKETRKDRGWALLMKDPVTAKRIIEKRKKTVKSKAKINSSKVSKRTLVKA